MRERVRTDAAYEVISAVMAFSYSGALSTEHLALPILFQPHESHSAVIKLSTDKAPLCFWLTVSIFPLSKETRSDVRDGTRLR